MQSEEIAKFRVKLPWMLTMRDKLADYFNKTTEDAKGFIKDPHDLSLALKALAYRENTIRSLISSLNESIQ